MRPRGGVYKIKVGREATAPLKGRVFKIGISKVSGSVLAAEICTGSHNRLLRRQHCSSLCSQSEGHKHVANLTSALRHNFVGFLARAWPPQYSPPSLCEQSELQCFAPGLRQMSARFPLQLCRTRHVICSQNRTEIFWILPPNLLIRSLFQQLIPITILRRIDIGKRFVNGLFVLPCSFPLVNTNQFVAFVFREKLRQHA